MYSASDIFDAPLLIWPDLENFLQAAEQAGFAGSCLLNYQKNPKPNQQKKKPQKTL